MPPKSFLDWIWISDSYPMAHSRSSSKYSGRMSETPHHLLICSFQFPHLINGNSIFQVARANILESTLPPLSLTTSSDLAANPSGPNFQIIFKSYLVLHCCYPGSNKHHHFQSYCNNLPDFILASLHSILSTAVRESSWNVNQSMSFTCSNPQITSSLPHTVHTESTRPFMIRPPHFFSDVVSFYNPFAHTCLPDASGID